MPLFTFAFAFDELWRSKFTFNEYEFWPASSHHWLPSIRCAWPDGVEFFAWRPPLTAGLCLFQTGRENLAIL